MNSAYQELRRENYQFESQHIIMLIKFLLELLFVSGHFCVMFFLKEHLVLIQIVKPEQLKQKIWQNIILLKKIR